MNSGSNIDRKPIVLAIVLLAVIGIFAFGGLSWLTVYISWISEYFVWWVAMILLIVFLLVAVALYRRLAPFLGAYTHDELGPLLEARVTTEKGKTPLKELIGNEKAILYFYSEDDPNRTNKVRAFQGRMKAYREAGIKVYGVSVPPDTTKPSDVPQQEHNQQFQVLVDKDKEAVNALRRLNTQVKEPQLALLIAPEGSLTKMYSEASSSTQVNKILEDAKVVAEGGTRTDTHRRGTSTMSFSNEQTTPTSTPETPSRPYNFLLALAGLLLATIIFGIVMVLFRDTFKDAALVTTALSTLFGIFGTVIGAYFGIKSSSDTSDKARREVAQANDKAGRALAALEPQEGKKITG